MSFFRWSLVGKRVFKCLIFLALFCLSQESFCQAQVYLIGDTSKPVDKSVGLDRYYIDILKSMKLTYKKPDGFKEVPGMECFNKMKKPNRLAIMLSCESNQLYADDEHFTSFMPLHRNFTQQDIIVWKKMFPKLNYDVNELHIGQIKGNINAAFGEKAALEWRNYVTYYSNEDAKNMFNADTVITFFVKLDSNEYYKGKYKYFDALFIQKNGRGFVNFYCFYDDEGKKNLAKYMKGIEGSLWYEN